MTDPVEYVPDPGERPVPLPDSPLINLGVDCLRLSHAGLKQGLLGLLYPDPTQQPSPRALAGACALASQPAAIAGDTGTQEWSADRAVLSLWSLPDHDGQRIVTPVLSLVRPDGRTVDLYGPVGVEQLVRLVAYNGAPPWVPALPLRLVVSPDAHNIVRARYLVDRGLYTAAVEAMRPLNIEET